MSDDAFKNKHLHNFNAFSVMVMLGKVINYTSGVENIPQMNVYV